MSEEADAGLVWKNRTEISKLEKEMADAEKRLKMTTGERTIGPFLVVVKSGTSERVDSDACRVILGERTPMKLVPSISLKVQVVALA